MNLLTTKGGDPEARSANDKEPCAGSLSRLASDAFMPHTMPAGSTGTGD
jgi:hypothetical protein